MDEIVDDSSIADGLDPKGPTNDEDEIESLPSATVDFPKSHGSWENRTCEDLWKDMLPSLGANLIQTLLALSIHGRPFDVYLVCFWGLSLHDRMMRSRMPWSVYGSRSKPLLTCDRFVHCGGPAFSGFVFKSTGDDFGSSEQRKQYRKQRFTRPTFEQSGYYVPPLQISNRIVTKRLIKIAQEFSFLDHFFADCFQAFEEASCHITIQENLLGIRNDLAKCQRQSSNPRDSHAVYIGSLGEFCESVYASWVGPASGHKIFVQKMKGYKNGLKYGEDYLVYLQDTLEVPYWQLIIDLLMDWRESNPSNTLCTAILYMLQYKALSCRNKVEELAQMTVADGEDRRGLSIMQGSIQKRLDVLDKALEVEMLDENLDVKAAATPNVSIVHSQHESETYKARLPTRLDASIQLALFVLFIILAFIPGYQGFAISAQSHEVGTTSDADFYYLIQSSLMSVLGNFAAALPLLQSGRVTGPLHFFWVFSALGLFSAVLSVVIYPLANTGWSSVLSFVGNVASAASVLILTIATAREQMSEPVSRSDGEHSTTGYADLDEKKKQ